ncbi:helix-turn-helix transcriptional regulator [Streptomyces phyllanthi]|uniref:Helix-turn-helix transcriptional regulator n=2 Tax=Streptomyces phyllanthi TaxID=1803180 RepID=A0A5N8VU25_9ACTN|nr:helix-turn-helix transcriptional regulator [Streptomyces phyllanthi]MPY38489.1 helix-turn-helix transcriptional regulator [Streptomyces phyllanthi]
MNAADQTQPSAPWLSAEEVAAARIQFEREIRGWSTNRLSDEMNAAGYVMNPSAVWRIEKGTPRRRIHLEEAIGFAAVFGLPLEELYKLGGSGAYERAAELTDAVQTRRRAADEAAKLLDVAERQLTAYLNAHPEVGNPCAGQGA